MTRKPDLLTDAARYLRLYREPLEDSDYDLAQEWLSHNGAALANAALEARAELDQMVGVCESLRDRLAVVEAELEFYADLSAEGPWHLPSEDYGKRARAALQSTPAQKEQSDE